MNHKLSILIFAFIGAISVNYVQAQTYDPFAVQTINNLIFNNGLNATPGAPETWDFAHWNNETPKQLIEFNIEFQLHGTALFSGLPTLQKLFCVCNFLDELDVTDCIQLQTLWCSDGRLTKLNLKNCTALQELNCVRNRLTELNVTNNTQLQKLYCNLNRLHKLDVTKNTQLISLGCSDNSLIEIDLTGLNYLEDFDGSYQIVALTLYQDTTEEYTCAISLNNPTFGNSAISYSEGTLKSSDHTVSSTFYCVQTNSPNPMHLLDGVFNFTYSNIGINSQDKIELQVYPNPTTGELRITSIEEQVSSVEVFDVYGRKLLSHHLIPSSSNHLINISHLNPGIYLVKITTDTGEVIKNVVKQ